MLTVSVELDRVAPNRTALADRIRARSAFMPTDLTADQRAILDAAIDGEYRAESSDNAAFEELVATFRGQEAIKRDGSSGTWLVRYAGDLWLAELRYYGFADSEPPAEPPAMPDEG
ncbi:MAG: hypothetical protein J07HN6_01181 [Halonotius sp. J07HN6]|nr:MAG: hypothetical protein J07HN6_01181 [Halonotius sp. J07HN6]ERH05065.1 MAG: hypothetical protein J07HN4v3_00657 [Halonotius sp. J07HN4]